MNFVADVASSLMAIFLLLTSAMSPSLTNCGDGYPFSSSRISTVTFLLLS